MFFRTSRRVLPQPPAPGSQRNHNDHGYTLPASPTAVKAKVNEHLARVESLEREPQWAKTTVKDLLGDLRENNLINEELSDTLAFYSDLKMDFVAKHEYT
ncbi:unnamed protein product [Arctogadus glacialis]